MRTELLAKRALKLLTLILCSFMLESQAAYAQCTDSDGNNSAIAGKVEVRAANGGTSTYTDYCQPGARRVIEHTCVNGAAVASAVDCRYGCYGGKCSGAAVEGESASYLRLTFNEAMLTAPDRLSISLAEVEGMTGEYASSTRVASGEHTHYLLQLLDSSGRIVSIYNAISGLAYIIDSFGAEDHASTGEHQHGLQLRSSGGFDVIVPFDATVTRLRLLDAADSKLLLEAPLSTTALSWSGCLPAGASGYYYQQNCCPGLFSQHVPSTASGRQQQFVCSLCEDDVCLPAAALPIATPALPPPSGANLLSNGGFETPVTASDIYPSTTSQSMGAWQVADQAGDDWVMIANNSFALGSRPAAAEGKQVLAFNTWSWGGHPGGARIFQNVNTLSGSTYSLSFKLSTWPDSQYVAGAVGRVRLKVWSPANAQVQLNNLDFVSPSNPTSWSDVVCTFTAAGSSTQISLEDIIPLAEKEKIGVGLDAVVLQAGAAVAPGTCRVGAASSTPPASTPSPTPSIAATTSPTPAPSSPSPTPTVAAPSVIQLNFAGTAEDKLAAGFLGTSNDSLCSPTCPAGISNLRTTANAATAVSYSTNLNSKWCNGNRCAQWVSAVNGVVNLSGLPKSYSLTIYSPESYSLTYSVGGVSKSTQRDGITNSVTFSNLTSSAQAITISGGGYGGNNAISAIKITGSF